MVAGVVGLANGSVSDRHDRRGPDVCDREY